jgi:hypothetical protein
MFRLLLSGFVFVIMLSGCGNNGAPTRHNDFTPLTSIQIVAVSPTIAALTSTKLSVIGNFSGLFTSDVTNQAVWSSNLPAVAAFVTQGSPNRVSGLTPGTAILTATVGSVSTTFSLTVSSATITTVTITPANPSVSTGLSTQFAASGTFSDATTQDLTFDATWASSAPGVASVSNSPSSKGLAQAIAVGPTTVSATFDGVTGSTLMTVTQPVLQSITVSPANPSILSASIVNFQATGAYTDGSTADITSQVTWTSSIPGIATIVANSGAATTLLQGTTTISATLNGVSGTSSLKVTGGNLTGIVISPATLSGVALSPANVSLVNNTLVRIAATGSFNNGSSRDITGAVAWSTSDPSIATVTTPGGNLAWLNALSTTLSPATVSATFGTVVGKTNLTVTNPSVSSISVSPLSLPLTPLASSRFTMTATFSDGTSQDVTATSGSSWTSNNVAVASVGNTGVSKGQVRGVATGNATITASYAGAPVSVTAPVTVTSPTLLGLTISGATSITSGNQVMFTATANYGDGTTIDVTADTQWTISNTNVAILADSQNQPGQVVAVDSGTTTITASFNGKTQTATITVP